VIGDLRDPYFCRQIIDRRFTEVYQLAADMGGAGFIFTGENDADVMHNSATFNLNVLRALSQHLWPEGTWTGGREKASAALCRKIAAAEDGDAIEIWGGGSQTRSFLYIAECIEGTVRLMRSGFPGR
jgi:NAD dependent epimerase/dehydratase family